MTTFNQFFGAGGGTLKYLRFTSSGTFTPSAALLAKGGLVFVRVVSGGGVGKKGGNSVGGTAGSAGLRGLPGVSGNYVEKYINVSSPVNVVVGGTSSVETGNASSFGDIVIRGGNASYISEAIKYLHGLVYIEATSGQFSTGTIIYGRGGRFIGIDGVEISKPLPSDFNGGAGADAPANSGSGGAGGGGASARSNNGSSYLGGEGGLGGSGFVEVWWYE